MSNIWIIVDILKKGMLDCPPYFYVCPLAVTNQCANIDTRLVKHVYKQKVTIRILIIDSPCLFMRSCSIYPPNSRLNKLNANVGVVLINWG